VESQEEIMQHQQAVQQLRQQRAMRSVTTNDGEVIDSTTMKIIEIYDPELAKRLKNTQKEEKK
jgi:hypothetical protein